MSNKKALKSFPEFKTDGEVEDFVENADLTAYDLSDFTPVRFEFEKKTAQVNLRMPEGLVKAIKDRARREAFRISASSARRWKRRWAETQAGVHPHALTYFATTAPTLACTICCESGSPVSALPGKPANCAMSPGSPVAPSMLA